MSVYFIVNYDIKDPELYKDYVPGVTPLLQKHGAEILVATYDAKQLEGTAREVNVVIKFASEEAAMGFYNDSAYAPVKKIRLESTVNGTVILAKQYIPPSA